MVKKIIWLRKKVILQINNMANNIANNMVKKIIWLRKKVILQINNIANNMVKKKR